MNPGGGSGWDEPPLDIQIPDDARELERDMLAYRREQRAKRRRTRLRRLASPVANHRTIMPVIASILAVCLVAGAMLSVATFSPATSPSDKPRPATSASATAHRPAPTVRPSVTGTSRASGRASRSASPSASSPRPAPSGSASSGTRR